MAYSKGSLVLTKATVADIPVLSTTFHRAFHDTAFYKAMVPDTPANDKWWQESHKIALLDPETHVVKMVDQENGNIAAMARWVLPGKDGSPQPGSAEDRWPEFTNDVDRTLADPLFAAMARGRQEFMGDRKHYCKLAESILLADVTLPLQDMLLTKAVLELLQVVEEYKGRGAGSLMIKYGCDLADKDGLEAYLDASMDGFPLYQRFGFVLKAEAAMPGGYGYIDRHMVRPAMRKTEQ
jgi:GNAT superfamily N-acetyltransferase